MKLKNIYLIFLGIFLFFGFISVNYALPTCTGTPTTSDCASSNMNGKTCGDYYSIASATVISTDTCTFSCTDGCQYCSCGLSDCSGSGTALAPCNQCTHTNSTTWQGVQCGTGGTPGTCEGNGGDCQYITT